MYWTGVKVSRALHEALEKGGRRRQDGRATSKQTVSRGQQMKRSRTDLNRRGIAVGDTGSPVSRRNLRPRRRRLVSESVPNTCRAAGVRRRSGCTCGTWGWRLSAPLYG